MPMPKEYMARKQRERRAARRASGLCSMCGKVETRECYCEDCKETRNLHDRCLTLVPFRNCHCGKPSTRTAYGSFFCDAHYKAEKSRDLMSPEEHAKKARDRVRERYHKTKKPTPIKDLKPRPAISPDHPWLKSWKKKCLS